MQKKGNSKDEELLELQDILDLSRITLKNLEVELSTIAKVKYNKGQYLLAIPKEVVEHLGINGNSVVTFIYLKPDNNKKRVTMEVIS
jgi:hypothetical protein